MEKANIYEAHFWNAPMEEELPLYPFCSEYSLRYQPHKIQMCRYPFMLICGIKEGALQFVFEKKKLLMEAGDVLLIPPRTLYAFESYSTKSHYGKQVLELKGSLLDDYLEKLHLNKVLYWQKEMWEEFSDTFERIHTNNNPLHPEDIPEFLAVLTRFLHICSLQNGEKKEEVNPHLAAACRWINEHLNIPIDLTLLEKKLNISRSTLCRLFRDGMGMSPRGYWIQRRKETAEFLLLHSDLSIKEIAFHLGYSSQFHFSREFARYHKLPPLHYRKKGPS